MMTMHSISPAQKVTSPMMSLSQTNTIPSDGLQPLNNNTIKVRKAQPAIVSEKFSMELIDSTVSF